MQHQIAACAQRFGAALVDRAGKRFAMYGDAPQHARELYAFREGAEAPSRLTRTNPLLDKVRMAPQRVVRYAARDGLEIEGVARATGSGSNRKAAEQQAARAALESLDGEESG